jgi:hypothetical protein
MFNSENQYIELTVRAVFSVADLSKASKLTPDYSWDNKIIGFYDEEGNLYGLTVALEVNEATDGVIWKQDHFKEKLGLIVSDYRQADFSKVKTDE